MASFTASDPPLLVNDTERDISNLREYLKAVISELRYLFDNLDDMNVSAAGSVKAGNIDCTQGKITSGQIKELQADKLRAGTIHLDDNITISGGDGKTYIDADTFVMYDGNGVPRVLFGKDSADGGYKFVLLNSGGAPTVSLNGEGGNAVFTGLVSASKIEASNISASSIEGGTIDGSVINTHENITVGKKLFMDSNNFEEGIYFNSLFGYNTSLTMEELNGGLRVSPRLTVNGETVATQKWVKQELEKLGGS